MDRNTFRFSADGAEYFQIWITNLVLSIITFGLYSPWAKVRRLRYFYQNTHLADGNFDYHGEPIVILKGRLVAVALFILYSIASDMGTKGTLAALFVAALVLPFLISRSLRFRLRNTSFKGVRLRFLGTAKQALLYYVGWQVLSFLTAFILFPSAQRALKEYQIGRSALGKDCFVFRCGAGPFYKAYILSVLAIAGSFALISILMIVSIRNLAHQGGGVMMVVSMFLPILIGLIGFAAARAATGMLQNAVWNSVLYRDGRFESSVEFFELLKIHFSNLVGFVLTLGLFKPFADIRLTKYRLERIQFISEDSLDSIVSSAEKEVSSIGEEVTDIFDIDLAL